MPSAIALLPNLDRTGEASLNASLGAARLPGRPEGAERTGNVNAVKTPVTPEQARALIADALEHVTGEKPTPESVAILTAQWAHETGRGASMYNYNFAGIKGTGPSGLTVAQRTREGWGATERTIVDNFRAYQTAEEGARDYVGLLKARFPAALDAAKQGDPGGTVRALKQAGYFTGDEGAYTRSVTKIAKELLPESVDFVPEPLPALPIDYASALAARDAGAHAPAGVPFVNPAAFSDHILQAALRIMSAPVEDAERRGGLT
jgi:hypothetical protein